MRDGGKLICPYSRTTRWQARKRKRAVVASFCQASCEPEHSRVTSVKCNSLVIAKDSASALLARSLAEGDHEPCLPRPAVRPLTTGCATSFVRSVTVACSSTSGFPARRLSAGSRDPKTSYVPGIVSIPGRGRLPS